MHHIILQIATSKKILCHNVSLPTRQHKPSLINQHIHKTALRSNILHQCGDIYKLGVPINQLIAQ